jgi:hypothetical protein
MDFLLRCAAVPGFNARTQTGTRFRSATCTATTLSRSRSSPARRTESAPTPVRLTDEWEVMPTPLRDLLHGHRWNLAPDEGASCCADSEHDARELSTAELDAPGASQALGCCKQESSTRGVGVTLPLSDTGSHDARAGSACTPRHARRSRCQGRSKLGHSRRSKSRPLEG